MKSNFYTDALILLIAFVAFVGLLFFIPQPTHQVINCSIAEISPDFTPSMRKECRMIRGTKL
jgi:hypothetical protein